MEDLSGPSLAFCAPKTAIDSNGIRRHMEAAVKAITIIKARATIFFTATRSMFHIDGNPLRGV
jgi:hypothetical protein